MTWQALVGRKQVKVPAVLKQKEKEPIREQNESGPGPPTSRNPRRDKAKASTGRAAEECVHHYTWYLDYPKLCNNGVNFEGECQDMTIFTSLLQSYYHTSIIVCCV